MKNIVLYPGGHKLRVDDFIHMQAGYKDSLQALCEGMGLGNSPYILSGCGITGTTNPVVAAGWIYYHDGTIGEVYPCDAATLSGTGTVKWKIVEEVVPYDGYPDGIDGEVRYQDEVYHNVHIIKKMVPTIDGTGEVSSDTTSTAKTILVGSVVPPCGIIMYSGPVDAFETTGLGKASASDTKINLTGWTLCNGATQGGRTVPDLRNKFVMAWAGPGGTGDGAFSGTELSINPTTGTTRTVSLTRANIPSHWHRIDSTSNNDYLQGGQSVVIVGVGSTSSEHYHSFRAGGNGSGVTVPEIKSSDKDFSTLYTGISGTGEGSHNHTGNTISGTTSDGATNGLEANGHTGIGTPFEIIPPHYVLAFIMKL